MVVRVGWVCVWLQLGPLGGVEVYEDAAQQDIVQGGPYVGTYYILSEYRDCVDVIGLEYNV